MMIEIQNVCFAYGQHCVLHDISFTAGESELLAVLGPNGVGKSTLFRLLLGLEKMSVGICLIDGVPADTCASSLAKRIAYVPQTHHPSFNYSVLDMVLMGTTIQVNNFSSPGPEQKQRALEALEQIGILHLKDRGYLQISGGEQQLVLIARALAQQAKIIVMDEPAANLDYGNQLRVMGRIKALTREGYTIIQSTHNPDHAFLFADRILALSDGRIVAYGPTSNTLTSTLIQTLYGVKTTVQRGENGMLSAIPDISEYKI